MAQKKTRPRGVKSTRAGRGAGELERYEKALEALERAIKSLYKGEVDKAKEQLERLKESHGEESDLMDRVQTLLLVCERRLSPQRKPKTAEEMSTWGVMLLNEGDSEQAVRVLSKALEMDPENPHIEYCLAAAHAKEGDAAETARHLRVAIQGDPLNRIHAKADVDFAPVRDQSEVASLLSGA